MALILPLILFLVAQPTPARQTPAASPIDFDALVARAMKTFEVPGVALTVVKDGRAVIAKGYGVRRLGEPAPVDDRTLFGIASNTKVFTAAATGQLVDAGKVQWDAPVVRYLPWFQMWDPWVTREITIRDLFVHRSGLGLGAGDLLWWPPSTYNRREIAERLRFIPPATSFRSAYAYDNVLYLIASEVIESVSGQSWEDYVEANLLRRLGMTSSATRHSAATKGGNVAATHAPVDGVVRAIKPFDSDNTNPAGGIMSNAADMSKWLIAFLAHGRLPDGSRLYSEATARQLETLVTPMPIGEPPPELAAMRSNFNGYALGLNVRDYRGRKMITHTGGLPGYVSRVASLPEIGLGVSVLTNQESGEAFNAIVQSVFDAYLGATDTDWVAAYQAQRARGDMAVRQGRAAAAATRTGGSRPSLPVEQYAGTYTDAWYGDITITDDAGKLTMRFTKTPLLVGDLEHWQQDTFIVRWRDRELRADAYVTFALRPDGSIEQAKMRAVSSETDFSFDFHDLLLKPKR